MKKSLEIPNLVLELLLASILTTFFLQEAVKSTQNILHLKIEIWIIIILCLSILFCCLLVFQIHSYYKNLHFEYSKGQTIEFNLEDVLPLGE